MSDDDRTTTLGGLWFFSAIVLIALFISAAAQGELTPGHMVLALVILGLAVLGTMYFLYNDNRYNQQAKAKRRGVDDLLGNLSDEEIIELKRRLSAVDDQQGTILDYIDDDGELSLRRQA